MCGYTQDRALLFSEVKKDKGQWSHTEGREIVTRYREKKVIVRVVKQWKQADQRHFGMSIFNDIKKSTGYELEKTKMSFKLLPF